jgi:hypothetical protein
MKTQRPLETGRERGWEAVGTGEKKLTPAPTASRRALLFPGNNLRSADSSSRWSFKRPLDATLSAFLQN